LVWRKLMCKKYVRRMVGAAMKSCGVLLVVSAIAGTALAIPPPPPTAGVPEIDPASIGSAMAILAGGLLMLTGRRHKS
jgi:hypothetical protein